MLCKKCTKVNCQKREIVEHILNIYEKIDYEIEEQMVGTKIVPIVVCIDSKLREE